MFELVSKYKPSGDQPQAIKELVDGINEGKKEQVLLGATGTGKTFTIANVIKETNKPTLVLAHNKTLAGQLYAELKEFFPNNHVEYFVSYYDYYQPEAYVPSSDTYIEKDSSINDEIDELRHAATSALINYKDVIVVASVSCIYGIGEKEEYEKNMLILTIGDKTNRNKILNRLIDMTYERNDLDFHRGTFRVRGNNIDIIPVNEKVSGIRIILEDDIVSEICVFDPLTGVVTQNKKSVTISPASHFVTSKEKLEEACNRIEKELKERLQELKDENKLIEEQRLRERTNYDLEMLRETGFCNGVENYSRHLALRDAGETPSCLIDFFPKDFLLVVDESHVTLPQVRGMYNGDRMRKQTLVDYGFRLPSALDNRPLRFEEFEAKINAALEAEGCELVVLAGFMRILSADFVNKWQHKIINIHPALLPSFPGLHGQKQAADYGVKFSGCTVHFVDAGTDSGPIILQKVVPVMDDDTEDTLADRILVQEHIAMPEALKLWAEGKLTIEGRKVKVKA